MLIVSAATKFAFWLKRLTAWTAFYSVPIFSSACYLRVC